MTKSHTLARAAADLDERHGALQPLLLTIPEAAALLSIGRTTLYELIGNGQIDVVHIGRSCRVPVDAVREFVAAKRAR